MIVKEKEPYKLGKWEETESENLTVDEINNPKLMKKFEEVDVLK